MKTITALLAVIIVLGAPRAMAATLVFKSNVSPAGYSGAADTDIREDTPTTTNGSSPGLNVGTVAGGPANALRSLLSFNLSALPAGSVISNVELRFSARTPDGPSTDKLLVMEVRKIMDSFTASQASWNNASSGTPWTGAGGSPVSDTLAMATVGTKGAAGSWHSFRGGKAFVAAAQAAFTNGLPLRLNVIALAQEAASDRAVVSFNSSETTTSSLRPELVVEYGTGPKQEQVRNSEHFLPVTSLGAADVWITSLGDPVVAQWLLPPGANPGGFLSGVDAEEWYHPAIAGSTKLKLRYKVLAVQGSGVSLVIKAYRRLSGQPDYWRKAVSLTAATTGFVDLVLEPGVAGTTFTAGSENSPVWEDMNFVNISVVGPAGSSLAIQVAAPEFLNGSNTVLATLWSDDRTVSGANFFHRVPQFYTQPSDNTGVTGNVATGRGLFILGRGSNILESPIGRATLLGLQADAGQFGLSGFLAFPTLARHQEWVQDYIGGAIYQQGGVYGLSEFVTKAGAWMTSPTGESRNLTPGLGGLVGGTKHFDPGSPAVWSAFDLLLDRLGATRVKEFQLIETYWPYFGGLWGQGDNEIANLRTSLNGADTAVRPIFTRDGVEVPMGFWDYFESRWGFRWNPSDLGYAANWTNYRPPTVAGIGAIPAGDLQGRKRYMLMGTLAAYQLIKFYQQVGESAFERDSKGIKLAVVPNKETLSNSFDCLGYLSGLYPHVVGFEFFGNPKHFAAYETGPVWHRMFTRRDLPGAPKEERMILETSVTGIGYTGPYWDPELAYAVTYDLKAGQQTDSAENDWVNWVDSQVGVDPAVTERYKDFAAKILAFSHAKNDGAHRPLVGEAGHEGLYGILSTRHVHHLRTSVDNSQYQLEKTAMGMHYPMIKFDLSQARDQGNFDRVPNILVNDLAHHQPGDITWLKNWLSSSANKVLIAHGFSLAKKPDGTNYAEAWGEFPNMNASAQSATLLGSAIAANGTPNFSSTAVTAGGDWAGDPLFTGVTLTGQITSYAYATPDMILLSAGGYPLVSKKRIYNSLGQPQGLVYYLHFRPTGNAVTGNLERRILEKLLVPTLKRDFLDVAESIADYKLHRYRTDHGIAVTAYHPVPLAAFNFVYDVNVEQLLPFEVPAATGSFKVRLPVGMPITGTGTVTCVDMLSGAITQKAVSYSGSAAYVTLSFDGYSCRLWQIVGTNAAQAQAISDRALYVNGVSF